MKALIDKTGRLFFYRGQDMHTQFGYVKSAELEKARAGSVLKTNTGRELRLIDAGFADMYAKIKRNAQIVPLKDLGRIVVQTGMGPASVVLDAGSGSGATACYFAHIAKKVVTYEVRDDFHEIVRKNIEMLGLKNVVQKKGSIYDNHEKNVDVMFLDVPEPWNAIETATKSIKVGGYLVNYSPTLPQVSDFVDAVGKSGAFVYLKTTETIEREWEIEGRKIRPKSQPIGHSGFLSFCRRV